MSPFLQFKVFFSCWKIWGRFFRLRLLYLFPRNFKELKYFWIQLYRLNHAWLRMVSTFFFCNLVRSVLKFRWCYGEPAVYDSQRHFDWLAFSMFQISPFIFWNRMLACNEFLCCLMHPLFKKTLFTLARNLYQKNYSEISTRCARYPLVVSLINVEGVSSTFFKFYHNQRLLSFKTNSLFFNWFSTQIFDNVSIQSIHSSVPPPETSVIFVDKTNISQVQDIRKVWLSKFFSNLT